MSYSLINHSKDLSKLISEKYNIEIRGGYLIIKNVPYLSQNEIKYADIVTSLNIDSQRQETQQPTEHTVWWTGEIPYNSEGKSMKDDLCCAEWTNGHNLGEDIVVYMQWSRMIKQDGQKRAYNDYYEQITTYIKEVSFHAESKTPGVLERSKNGEVNKDNSDERFVYINSSQYRNGTKGIEDKISDEIVAVIGVGGTGSYLVDVLVKTNIKELHLYDHDTIETDSAFRLAGAVHKNEFGMAKVDWHEKSYKNIRAKGLHTHKNKIDNKNLDTLKNYNTVFIAVDNLNSRREIQRKCNELGVFHLSVGIGVEKEGENDSQLVGMVKIEKEYQVNNSRNSTNIVQNNQQPIIDIYRSNIQTAELNMLGAALAIIEWKIKKGIYRSDRDSDHNLLNYATPSGTILMGK